MGIQNQGFLQEKGQPGWYVPVFKLTIKQFIDKHKIVLDGLFIEFSKIALPQSNQAVQEFEDQCSVGIALCDCHEVDVFVFDMAEGGRAQCEDGTPHLGIRDDLDAEDVCQSWPTVAAECTEDEILAFLVEYQDAA